MSAVGVARAAPPFLLGFDVLEPVTDAMLGEARDEGFRWVGRYINNLTAQERDRIFAAGLGILPYTEAMTGEALTAATGQSYGRAIATSCVDLEMAPTVHVPIDLELPAAGSDVASHVNAMAYELVGVGFGAALYVGVPQPLTSRELFALVPDRYIKGGGRIVDRSGFLAEPKCGWAALQLEPLEGHSFRGVKVDVEISKLDYQGRALVLWWPS